MLGASSETNFRDATAWEFGNVQEGGLFVSNAVVSRLQTFRPWRLIRHYRRTLTGAMLCSKLTANMSHKQ